ncbi:Hypothetical protein A7982_00569 [Minicystis rosea]|nr:Hypothetical protein A7982_00569 [Minicystis rosea]
MVAALPRIRRRSSGELGLRFTSLPDAQTFDSSLLSDRI